jgi:hypothetical protein
VQPALPLNLTQRALPLNNIVIPGLQKVNLVWRVFKREKEYADGGRTMMKLFYERRFEKL